MRALVVKEFAPYANHAIEELADPKPAPDEVIIETRAMSLNFPDVLIVEGLYQHKPTRPFIPGFDAAGVVSAVGTEVSGFEVGDRVVVLKRGRKVGERNIRDTSMDDVLGLIVQGDTMEAGDAN